MNIGNTTPTKIEKQRYFLAPPSKPKERKDPQDCFRSYIDQIQDGCYSSSKLIRNTPRKTSDSHFIVRTFKAEVRSYRRNYSHRNVALFKTKRDGPTRTNIAYITGSFLELDGSTDGTIKTQGDVLTLIRENNIPTASYVIETSKGRFHLIWTYVQPLPWTTKGESYFLAQQKRLIELFEQGGFFVDKGASMNPCQNLRNPSQLQPFNFKQRCKVQIHSTYSKTSLRRIYKALNKTSVPNPRPIQASIKLRRYLRANQTFEITLSQLAITLGTCTKTAQREVRRAIQNGDLRIIARSGNNKRTKRATEYLSKLYIEPQFSGRTHSISTINSLPIEGLLRDFKQKGTSVGRRQKTIFALGLYLKAQLGKRACIGAIRAELGKGAMRCHVSEREFERTLRNVMKDSYTNSFSLAKMREWGLLQETMQFQIL